MAKTNSPWKGFLTYNLTPKQKEILKGMNFEIDQFDQGCNYFAESGLKLSISYSPVTKAWTASCTIINQSDPHPFAGYALTAKGSTAAKSIKALFYIHVTLLKRDWAALIAEQGQEVVDD